MLLPATEVASTITGMIMAFTTSHTLPPCEGHLRLLAFEGSHPSRTVKKYTRISARKNPGMLEPKNEAVTTAKSRFW